MRRKDRERDAAFALEVMRDCEYATLATVNPDGTPYCIPVSVVVIGNIIYFHCATEGQKTDNIKRNNAVCISGVRYTKLIPEKFTVEYESAVAAGKCEPVSSEAEKIAVFHALCEKYAKNNTDNINDEIAKSENRVCICKVRIEKITGKANTQQKKFK